MNHTVYTDQVAPNEPKTVTKHHTRKLAVAALMRNTRFYTTSVILRVVNLGGPTAWAGVTFHFL